jgi:hypothetical protein
MASTRVPWPDANTLRRRIGSLERAVRALMAYVRNIPAGPQGPQGPPGPSALTTQRVASSVAISLPSTPLANVLLDSTSGPLAVSLGAGNTDGQRAFLVATSDATPFNAVTIQLAATDAIGEPLSLITLQHRSAGVQLMWDGTKARWVPMSMSFV